MQEMDQSTDECKKQKTEMNEEHMNGVEHSSSSLVVNEGACAEIAKDQHDEPPSTKKLRSSSNDMNVDNMENQKSELKFDVVQTKNSSLSLSSLPLPPLSKTECVAAVRKHYEWKGYRVHSGLQFGTDLVLYADAPDRVHSDFCIHVMPEDKPIDWRTIQTLVRSMPDLHKTLYLVNVHRNNQSEDVGNTHDTKQKTTIKSNTPTIPNSTYIIRELAIGSEHAPFRQKHIKRTQNLAKVGTQTKPNGSTVDSTSSA